MIAIKNTHWNTKNLFEPIAFGSIALLAGSDRFIQYFPDASKKGIFMAALFSGCASYLYDRTLRHPDHSYFRTLLGKGAAIALGTFPVGFCAASLGSNVSLSLLAAGRFGALEFGAAASIAKICQETPLQKQHRNYSSNQSEWINLSAEDRKKFIRIFYEAGLPAITLIKASQDDMTDCLQELHLCKEKLSSYNAAQLSWYREFVQFEFLDHGVKKEEFPNAFEFNEHFQKSGIPLLKWNMANNVAEFISKSPKHIEMVYQEFAKEPIYRWFCDGDFDELFANKAPLPSLEQGIKQLKASEIEVMAPEILYMWHFFFEQDPNDVSSAENPQAIWNALSESIREAFLKRFAECLVDPMSLKAPANLTWLGTLMAKKVDAQQK